MDDYNYHILKYKNEEEFYHQEEDRQQRRHRYDDDHIPFAFGFGFGMGRRAANVPDTPIITEAQFFYELQLIPHELVMQVYDEGIGIHPLPGQFVTLRQKIYLQGEQAYIKKGITSYLYGRKRMIPGLQLALSMARERMKVRLKIASKLGYGQLRAGTIPPNSTLMMDFIVNSIDSFPHDDDKQLQHIYCEIVNCSSEGDRQFQKENYAQALRYYERAQQRIMIQDFSKALKERKKPSYGKPVKKSEMQLLTLIEEDVQKISLKALEIALVNEEYFKVIKWGYPILMNPNFDKNQRGLMARARAFIEVNEFEFAIKDLKLVKMMHPEYEPVERQFAYLQKKKKQYQEDKERYSHFAEVEQENFKKINQKKQPKYDDYCYF